MNNVIESKSGAELHVVLHNNSEVRSILSNLVSEHYSLLDKLVSARGIPIDLFFQTGNAPDGAWVPDQVVPSYRGHG